MSLLRTLILFCIIITFTGCRSSQPVEGELPDINIAPSISDIEDQTISRNAQLGPLSFTVHDRESDPDSLLMYATSSNPSLADTSGICFGGSGENRYLTIFPKLGTEGQTTIVIHLSDGTLTDSTFFILTVVSDEANRDYPTTLHPLSEAELKLLKAELESLAGGTYRVSLNAYGMLEKGGMVSRGISSIDDPNVAVTRAKSSIVYMRKFSNVYDTLALSVQKATKGGAPLFDDWTVIFENQVFQGFEVMLTEIMVLINDRKTQINGYHFRDMFIPEHDRIDEATAKRTAVGYTFQYSSYGGPETFQITEDAIIDELELVILPLETEKKIELRLVWRIPVSTEYMYGSYMPDFYVFMDVLEGTMLDVWQLFIA